MLTSAIYTTILGILLPLTGMWELQKHLYVEEEVLRIDLVGNMWKHVYVAELKLFGTLTEWVWLLIT